MSYFYTNVHLYKGNYLIRGYDGVSRVKETIKAQPYMFVPVTGESTSELRTLDGQRVEKVSFNTPYDARQFISGYQDVDGFKIYGMERFIYPFIRDFFPKKIEYNPALISVVNIDIECAADEGFPDIKLASKEITAITISKNGKYVAFGCGEFVNKTAETVTYIKCVNETDLLRKFLGVWTSPAFMPDVVTGWNVEFFDIPYLVNRITKVLSGPEARTLSPWSILDKKTIEIMGKEQETYVPVGITILDYIQLYKKFSYTPQESYKLDHIAESELGEKKLDYSEHGSLLALYKEDHQKFIEYNIRDVWLVDKLEAKMKFIEQVFAMSYSAKICYSDALTTVCMWDVIIHNYLMDRNIVVPSSRTSISKDSIIGGYVKEVKPGMYRWVVSFDLNSLYPHLIMQYNISPDTYYGKIADLTEDTIVGYVGREDVQNYLHENNITVCATGHTFKKDKRGFLAELMETMYNERVIWKKEMLATEQLLEDYNGDEAGRIKLVNHIAHCNNMQMAKKIQLNSAYGALGNEYFRWYDLRYAESITMSGRLSIKWIERDMNKFMNDLLQTENVDYIVAVDTDSIYVDFGGLVAKYGGDTDDQAKTKILNDFCVDIVVPYIDESYKKLATTVNAAQQKMFMKRECITNRAIWTAKKRYILSIYNKEGVAYTEPKIKIVGMEAIRSSTPAVCRKAIKDTVKIIMTKTETDVIEYIDSFRKDFNKMGFNDVAFPRGVSDISKYKGVDTLYKKSTPIAVRGSIIYNYLIEKHKLENSYQLITDNNKVKFAYLLSPNPAGSNIISVIDDLPVEFNLGAYIDYRTQFDKSYLEPMKKILDSVGWKHEKKHSLLDLMGRT